MIRVFLPPRSTLIVAGLAAIAAVGMHALAWTAGAAGLPAARLASYAATFEALPLWLVIGTVMHQIGSAIDTALTAWRGAPEATLATPHDGWNDDDVRRSQ